MRKAIIDVGSNSVILLVGESSSSGWKFVEEFTRVTALGENTKKTGLLGEPGMVATLQALRDFFELARQCGALDIQAWATMAARIAKNTPEFQARALAQGTPVEILSGQQEAQLGFESVVHDAAFRDNPVVSIIDPGGQSTELVTATKANLPFNAYGEESVPNQVSVNPNELRNRGWTVQFRRSFPIGTLALRGGLLSSEQPNPPELLRAVAELDETIGLEYLPGCAGTAVVLGATGTNLVSIRDQLTSWDPDRVHGALLRYDEVSRSVADLSALTDAGRASLVGIEPGRERTVHLGALILERFMYMIHALDVRVSVRGWRHALLQNGLP